MSAVPVPNPDPSSAFCALHIEVAAADSCARCGHFMCAGCLASGPDHTCPACQRRAPVFPIRRGEVRFGPVWKVATQAFSRAWVPLSAAALITIVVSAGLNLLQSAALGGLTRGLGQGAPALPTMLFSLLNGALSLGLGMGLVRMGVQAYRGQEVSLGLLFTQFRQYDKLLGLAGMNLLVVMILTVFAGMSVGPLGLFMLPALLGVALVYGIHFSFIMMSVVVAPHLRFGQHVSFARGLLSGNTLTVGGLYLVGGVLVCAAALLLVLPALAAIAFMNLLGLGAFLALANDEGFE